MVLRIFKIIATSGFMTALKCAKFIFGRGFAPGPKPRALLGELTALPQVPYLV